MATANTASEVLASARPTKKLDLWKGFKTFARRQPIGMICAFIVIGVTITAIFAPFIQPYGETDVVARRLEAPSSEHLIGTDDIGRDVFSRTVNGARVSLMAGVIAVAIGTASGAVIGISSGYAGGRADLYIQRLVDAMLSMPSLILAMVLVTIMGTGLINSLLAIGIILIPTQSRIFRSSTLSIKQEMYVEAAKAIGASTPRILVRHIFPQVLPLIIIVASAAVAVAIIVEASLSFLGLGVQPPTPSWGNMLSGPGRAYLETAPWLVIGPGVAISITVLAYNLLGDALRDVLDPRLRGSRR